ncbi:MAG TPA: hypothetical protein VFV87_19530 [Pirellulaceae bacterium]|nr:hypothetical protein [Pirellulaceae bacterium]
MKGPSERLKYDLRRLWECPTCHKRERTPGSVTFRHCLCRMKELDGAPVVMRLVEDGPQRVTPPIVIPHEPLPPLPAIADDLPAGTASEPPTSPEPPTDAR